MRSAPPWRSVLKLPCFSFHEEPHASHWQRAHCDKGTGCRNRCADSLSPTEPTKSSSGCSPPLVELDPTSTLLFLLSGTGVTPPDFRLQAVDWDNPGIDEVGKTRGLCTCPFELAMLCIFFCLILGARITPPTFLLQAVTPAAAGQGTLCFDFAFAICFPLPSPRAL